MNFGDCVSIGGCRLKARHLETSTGNGSLDALLGDALPNTSFAVIDEISSRSYADVLLKYFISEAIFCSQDVLLIDMSGKPSLLNSLPSRIEKQKSDVPLPSDNDMKIAWRYSNVGAVNSAVGTSSYDLGKPIEDQSLIQARCRTYPPTDAIEVSYGVVFNYLSELLSSEAYSKNGPKGVKKSLLRIVIRELDGTKWSDHENLPKFVTLLLPLLRSSYAVVMASTSSSCLSLETKQRMEACSDLFIRLTEISAQEKKEISNLDKYHGFVHIVKLPRLSSVCTAVPPASDLVFELHRKSFDIKILHLPPALGDAKDEAKKSACGVDF